MPVALVGAERLVGRSGIVARLLRSTILRPRVAMAVGEPIDVRAWAGVTGDRTVNDATVRRVADEVMAVLVAYVADLRDEVASHPRGVPEESLTA